MNAHSAHALHSLPTSAGFAKPSLTDQAAFKPLASLRTPRWRQPRFSAGSLALTVSAGILLAFLL